MSGRGLGNALTRTCGDFAVRFSDQYRPDRAGHHGTGVFGA